MLGLFFTQFQFAGSRTGHGWSCYKGSQLWEITNAVLNPKPYIHLSLEKSVERKHSLLFYIFAGLQMLGDQDAALVFQHRIHFVEFSTVEFLRSM
jgi:hypothetical protein